MRAVERASHDCINRTDRIEGMGAGFLKQRKVVSKSLKDTDDNVVKK